MSFRCKTRDRNALAAINAASGFSLIEVVLAVGIVAFAVIAIIALFGSSLESGRQVTDEDEALGIVRALPAYLQTQSFATVYGWILASSSASVSTATLYAFNIVPAPLLSGTQYGDAAQMAIIYSNTSSALTTGSTSYLNRAGRLFAINLALSPNMPIHLTGTSTTVTVQPTTSQLAQYAPLVNGSTNYGESVLPIRATIYSVPAIPLNNQVPANDYPVFTYDTAVSR